MTDVVIIEDNESILRSFEEIINTTQEFKVIGGFTNCEDALEFCENATPEIILVDIKLPGINGIEGVRRFKNVVPNTKCVMISVHEESNYIFEALSAGAIGYLTKNTTFEELIAALKQVNQGGSPMSGQIARKVIAYFQPPKQQELSDRENEVLKHLARGKSYATIADELNLSINTIKTHTRNIYEKLHIRKRKELMERFDHF